MPSVPAAPAQPVAQPKPELCAEQHVNYAFPTPPFTNVLTAGPAEARPLSLTSEWCGRREDWSQPKPPPLPKLPASPPPRSTSTASLATTSALQALRQQGVGLQQVTMPRDLLIPTGHDSPPVSLVAGQKVMVIKTPKGIYLRLEEKIIKIKQPAAVEGLLGPQLGAQVGLSGDEREEWVSTSS